MTHRKKDLTTQRSVDIVIPSWNGKDYLDTCLASLHRQAFKDFRIIVVDNASTDGTVSLVKEKYPEVDLITLPINKGFSGAVNEGIQASQGQYIALLNQDTETDPHWLDELIKAFDTYTDIDFCASKIKQFDNRNFIDSAGDGFLRGGISFKSGSGQEDGTKYNSPREVFGACAAASIYRRRFFEKVGLFDDDIGDYSTDGDINFRAQLLGLNCWFVPSAIVFHHVAASTTVGSPQFIRRINRNAVITAVKNYPLGLIMRNILRITAVFLSTLWIYPHPLAALRGRLDTLTILPRLLRKRRKIQKQRKASLHRINKIMSRDFE
jgi:GT2 family glycosyltransferase